MSPNFMLNCRPAAGRGGGEDEEALQTDEQEERW